MVKEMTGFWKIYAETDMSWFTASEELLHSMVSDPKKIWKSDTVKATDWERQAVLLGLKETQVPWYLHILLLRWKKCDYLSETSRGKKLPYSHGNTHCCCKKIKYFSLSSQGVAKYGKRLPDDLAHPSLSNRRHTSLKHTQRYLCEIVQYQTLATTAFIYADHFVSCVLTGTIK